MAAGDIPIIGGGSGADVHFAAHPDTRLVTITITAPLRLPTSAVISYDTLYETAARIHLNELEMKSAHPVKVDPPGSATGHTS
jgi:hypothetical protein